MKNTINPWLAASVAVALTGASQGALLMHESFENYAVGSSLAGQTGAEAGQVGAWTLQGEAAAWTIGGGIDGGQGLVTTGSAGDGDLYVDLNTPSVGGQIWVSYEVSTDKYGGHFYLSTSGSWAGAFGHAWNSTVTINNTTAPNDVPFPLDGTTITLVEMIDYNTSDARVWVNPAPGATPALGTEDVIRNEGMGSDPSRLILRNYDNNGVYDNIRIGTTFQDVVVPEPSVMTLFGLAGLALFVRRRK